MKIQSVLYSYLLLALTVATSNATLVFLDNTGTGADLDGFEPADVPTAAINVTEIPGLTIQVTGLTGDGPGADLNTTATSMGINAESGDDDTDAFDADFLESVTFRFNQAVEISQLDFTNFEDGDVFNFGGTSIEFADLSNATTDVYDFTTPLSIAADTDFTLEATTGAVGIEAFDVTVVAAIPEPGTLALFSTAFLGLMIIRRKII